MERGAREPIRYVNMTTIIQWAGEVAATRAGLITTSARDRFALNTGLDMWNAQGLND